MSNTARSNTSGDLFQTLNPAARKKRLHAKPVRRILDRDTRNVVGWLYEWNTGEHVPMWKNKPVTNIIYE